MVVMLRKSSQFRNFALVALLLIQQTRVNNCFPFLYRFAPVHPCCSTHRFKIGSVLNAKFDLLDTRNEDPITIPEDAKFHLVQFVGQNVTLQMEGYISKRRALGSSLAFLDLVVNNEDPVQVILRRDLFQLDDEFDGFFGSLQPGVVVRLDGYSGPSRKSGEIVLFATCAKFLRPNGNPQHLRRVLVSVLSGQIESGHVASSLNLSTVTLLDYLAAAQEGSEDVDDSLYTLAKQLLAPLSNLLDPSRLMGSSKNAKLDLLPAIPKPLRSPPFDLLDNFTLGDEIPQSVKDILDGKAAHGGTCLVVGWVQNRRRYQGNVTVLELVDDYASSILDESQVDSSRRIKCILSPQTTPGNLTLYGNLLCPGARVLVQACIEPSENQDGAILWITQEPRLLRSSTRPNAVRYLLDLLHLGEVDAEDVSEALSVPLDEADELASIDDPTKRQWMAAELSRNLQDETSRRGQITAEMQSALDRTANLRKEFPMVHTEIRDLVSSPPFLAETAKETSSMFKKSLPGSKWQRAKLPQLQWMISQIRSVVESHPHYNRRRLSIVDVGGGRGHLANLVAREFSEVADVRVIDISVRSINNGMMSARRNNLENIRFDVCDATSVNLEGVDIVVALHACGALSDVAMGHAISNGAAFVVCPCCFRSNSHLRIKLPLLAELVPASEWLQVSDQELLALQRVAEMQGDMNLAGTAIHSICALRASAVHRHRDRSQQNAGETLKVSIRTFPVGLSTRNFCIVSDHSS